MSTVRLLLVSGSLRAASTNTAALRTASSVAPSAVVARLDDTLGRLPHFNPDEDHEPLPPAVAELRRGIAQADAVLFCTPEYAGDLPGSFKNLLDWTVGGVEIVDKPVGWINISTRGPDGARHTHESLGRVLHFTGARPVEAACRLVPVPSGAVGDDGLIGDAGLRAAVAEVVATLAAAATHRAADA